MRRISDVCQGIQPGFPLQGCCGETSPGQMRSLSQAVPLSAGPDRAGFIDNSEHTVSVRLTTIEFPTGLKSRVSDAG